MIFQTEFKNRANSKQVLKSQRATSETFRVYSASGSRINGMRRLFLEEKGPLPLRSRDINYPQTEALS